MPKEPVNEPAFVSLEAIDHSMSEMIPVGSHQDVLRSDFLHAVTGPWTTCLLFSPESLPGDPMLASGRWMTKPMVRNAGWPTTSSVLTASSIQGQAFSIRCEL